MPIYEYRCGACAHHLEALQKMSEGPLRKCPECGKSQLRRLVSAPQFRLKGSGWYETDFKNQNEKKRNLVETGAKDAGTESKASDDSTATKPKDEASKAVTAEKGDGAVSKPAEPKPKAAASARKPAAKARATKPART